MADAARQVPGKVISTSPLIVRSDGSTVDALADRLASATVAANDPVQLTLRTPRRPLVTGVEA